ncbi:hypothetical protein [Jiulongibacter sp. NS-SX5]|uniref:hypothetical protein n=1 Tax=Jiulongibacter sp. NS-SX5 TaxID=3463854 RepID=UPI00405A1524
MSFKSSLTILLVVLLGSAHGQKVSDTSKGWAGIFKIGGQLQARQDLRFSSYIQGNIGYELKVNSKNTLEISTKGVMGDQIDQYDHEALALNWRRYFQSQNIGESIIFDGVYLSAKVYNAQFFSYRYEGTAQEFFQTARVFVPRIGAGLEFGRQNFGLIDFGVFAGLETGVVESGKQIHLSYNYEKEISPLFKSYARLHLPISFKKSFYQNFNAYHKPSFNRNKLLKLGIDQAFSFSKKGLFLHPKLGYEYGLGSSKFAIDAMGEGLITRAKLYDLTHFDSVAEISENAYVNQSLVFNGSVDTKLYLKNDDLQLDGFYVRGGLLLHAGSLEVKRQYWEFEKFNKLFARGGIGLQKQLFNDLLLDFQANLKLDKTAKPTFDGGLNLYWVK